MTMESRSPIVVAYLLPLAAMVAGLAALSCAPDGEFGKRGKSTHSRSYLMEPMELSEDWVLGALGPWVSGFLNECPEHPHILSVHLGAIHPSAYYYMDDPWTVASLHDAGHVVLHYSRRTHRFAFEMHTGRGRRPTPGCRSFQLPAQGLPSILLDRLLDLVETWNRHRMVQATLDGDRLYDSLTQLVARMQSGFLNAPGRLRTGTIGEQVPHGYLAEQEGDHVHLVCAATPIQTHGWESAQESTGVAAVTADSCLKRGHTYYLGTGDFDASNMVPLRLAVAHANYRPPKISQIAIETHNFDNIAMVFSDKPLPGLWAKMPPAYDVVKAPETNLFGVGYGSPRTGAAHLWQPAEISAYGERMSATDPGTRGGWYTHVRAPLSKGDDGGGVISDDNVLWAVVSGVPPASDTLIYLTPVLEHHAFLRCALQQSKAENAPNGIAPGATWVDRAHCDDAQQDRRLFLGSAPTALSARKLDLWDHEVVVEGWEVAQCLNNGVPSSHIPQRRISVYKKGQVGHRLPVGQFAVGVEYLTTLYSYGPLYASVQTVDPMEPLQCPSSLGACKEPPERAPNCSVRWESLGEAARHAAHLVQLHVGVAPIHDAGVELLSQAILRKDLENKKD